ncbi:hypothetical protein LY76DRAFT_70464 [Colletotrichum caudatum]|nr:hypothetical protein LY76DRAFT_70464 [Colletotrichum caudatum]
MYVCILKEGLCTLCWQVAHHITPVSYIEAKCLLCFLTNAPGSGESAGKCTRAICNHIFCMPNSPEMPTNSCTPIAGVSHLRVSVNLIDTSSSPRVLLIMSSCFIFVLFHIFWPRKICVCHCRLYA